jgi:hypothetical protein
MSERSDDPIGIPDSTRLFRRISPHWVVYDKNRGEKRPTSQNFQNSKDETPMSVYAENVAILSGEVPADFLRGRWATWHLAAIPAGWMRECGQHVYLDPENQDADDIHPSHTAVAGEKPSKIRPKLGERFEWVVAPPAGS